MLLHSSKVLFLLLLLSRSISCQLLQLDGYSIEVQTHAGHSIAFDYVFLHFVTPTPTPSPWPLTSWPKYPYHLYDVPRSFPIPSLKTLEQFVFELCYVQTDRQTPRLTHTDTKTSLNALLPRLSSARVTTKSWCIHPSASISCRTGFLYSVNEKLIILYFKTAADHFTEW